MVGILTLFRFNINAIAEVYDSIKFQCSVCGLRFIRNLSLKRHLDDHFQKSNEFLRKQRCDRAIGRPQFILGASDFTNAAKNRRTAAGGPGDSKDGAGAR